MCIRKIEEPEKTKKEVEERGREEADRCKGRRKKKEEKKSKERKKYEERKEN